VTSSDERIPKDSRVDESSCAPCRARIAVIGPEEATDEALVNAELIGRAVGRIKGWVVTGGRGGVMAAACKGALEVGGMTVGVLPGTKSDQANPYVMLPIPTGMDEARDAIVVNTADVIIAVEASSGTVAEVALAVKSEKPIVTVGKWDLPEVVRRGVVAVETAEEAIVWALNQVGIFDGQGEERQETPSLQLPLEERIKLLDGVQRHYESDLALHSGRMSLFLVAEAGLLGFAIHNASGTGRSFADAHREVIGGFGIVITLMWFIVGLQSWLWVTRFRDHFIEEAKSARLSNYGAAAVHIQREKESFLVRVLLRPTFVLGIALPVPFFVAWVWLGFKG
jgi:uncharacterized protein (TIGR00725 family)